MDKVYRREIQGRMVNVTVTHLSESMYEWVEAARGAVVFGLDVEWRPNFVRGQQNPAALLQLAVQGAVLIVQLLHMDGIPRNLADLLGDPSMTFVGKGIIADCAKLYDDHGIQVYNPVELGSVAARRYGNYAFESLSLRNLSQHVLGENLPHDRRITMSRWDEAYLYDRQIDYAAADALVSLLCYLSL